MSPVSNRPGFTLLELMISVAIIGILTVITFGNFAGQSDKNAVKQAANQLATDLERQFTQAQSGTQINGATPSGYGVYINPATTASYLRYGDLDIAGTAGYGYYNLTDQTTIQTRPFPKNIVLDRIQKNIAGAWVDMSLTSFQYMIPGANFTVHETIGAATNTISSQVLIRIKHVSKPYTACLSVTPNVGAVNIITCP